MGIKEHGKKAAGCCGGICSGLCDFIFKSKFLELALAVLLGGATKDVVDSFVAAFITPLLGMIGDPNKTTSLQFTVNGSVFNYGLFLDALIAFIIICTLVYFAIVVPYMAVMARLYPTRECPECMCDDLPAASLRCKYCCSAIGPAPKNVDNDEDISMPPVAVGVGAAM